MINTLLIFPIIACILVLLIKNRTFNTIMINLYALIHFVISVGFAFGLITDSGNEYFALDSINKIFLLILSFIFLMVGIYNTGYVRTLEENNKRISHYSFMTLVFVLSMTGTLLSTDLGLSWVLIEATTLSSAYLIYFHKSKNAIEAAWKYVFICSIGIALAFVGIIFLNVASNSINSLNFSDLYESAATFDIQWLKLAYIFMLFGFGAKMGLAPAHFWLPDAHSEAPSPISALLSATLLNTAFLVIVRVYKIMEIAHCVDYARIMLFLMGFLSLFVTAVFAFHIKNYKRMLAYSSIENMGILVIGLALGPVAYFATVLHLIGHSLVKGSFFLTSGNILELFKSKKVKSVKGIIQADVITGWLWVVSFLAICAFPTSLLFISEFLIIKAMLLRHNYILCALFMILLTIILYGIGRAVIKTAFGRLNEERYEMIASQRGKINLFMYVPQIIMLILVFGLGLYMPDCLNNIVQLAASAF